MWTGRMNEAEGTEFERLYSEGMDAKDGGVHGVAQVKFSQAADIAVQADDGAKALDALQPLARAEWTSQNWGAAGLSLFRAAVIAHALGMRDQRGMIISNRGRLAANEVMCTVSIERQVEELRLRSVPLFVEAQAELVECEPPHPYFEYANAQHGAVVTAMARRRRTAASLIAVGMRAAFRQDDYYEAGRRVYRTNPRGIGQMAVAAALIPLGNKTPILARYARRKLIR